MLGTDRASRTAIVTLAGALGVMAGSSAASAQVRRQAVAQAAQAPAAQTPPQRRGPRTPVVANAGGLRIGFAGERHPGREQFRDQFLGQFPGQFPNQFPNQFRRRRDEDRFIPPVVFYPTAGYGYGYPYGCIASVCDVNGHPVMRGFDEPEPYHPMSPAMVPDLSGSPYVVLDGGVMFVDFGNGDRRNVSACAQQASAWTPDGQPRTIFYTPPADGLILRAGSRGRVIGSPQAGASMCYGLDQYGRVALDY